VRDGGRVAEEVLKAHGNESSRKAGSEGGSKGLRD
jgi:hypothetical protein